MSCYCPSKQIDDGTGVSLVPNYIIAATFGQCMYTNNEIASVVIGWFSIVCWIIATYPQMRMSFLLKRCEAISVAFLILWFIGDILNLVSLIVIKGLFTQIILGSIWFVMDVILNGQYFYYHRKNKGKDLSDQGIKAITHYRVSEVTIYIIIAASVITSFLCYAIPAGNYIRVVTTLEKYNDLTSCNDISTAQYPEPRWWAGTVMAYCTIPLYCFNRVLQVVKNFKKKEMEDLSMGLFILTMLANIFQFISIIIADTSVTYLKSQAPYLFGAIFPVAMDAFILGQILYYNKKHRQQKDVKQHYNVESSASRRLSSTHDNDSTHFVS